MIDPREAWKADEPPSDFADKVMATIDAKGESAPQPKTAPTSARRRARVAGVVGAIAMAASLAVAIGWRGTGGETHGSAIVADRTEIAIGARATAVLERGAHVEWSGNDVTQSAGDVFYRVEKGGPFRVHTPAGDVAVLGTCFRVKVEETMNGRDLKAGAIGAALSAAAFVSVYEGKVAVSHASERVTLTAGETARAGADGVQRGAAGAGAEAPSAAASDPLLAANANLADSVHEYKKRLETIEEQKTAIAKQLGEAQAKLAAQQNDGQAAAPAKSEYDLDANDWKKLAKEGRVVARAACPRPDEWDVKPSVLNKLGLAPEDAQPIHDALKRSADRTWGVVRGLCTTALGGSAELADKLGEATCFTLVADLAQQKENTSEETHLVAEIHAGLKPMDPAALGSYGQMIYAMSGEAKAIEADLAQSIGPEDARRFTYGDGGNWCNNSWGVGPRPELPPK
ncbi:MAG TPA: FecR domain-containing protein [Polyangiaceae bacterium]